jgi:two-component system KDP operon response regulator KdpE
METPVQGGTISILESRSRIINQARNKLILIVDDEPKVLRFMEIELKLFGYDVVTATRGLQALEIIETQQPDMILLDIMMPEMDGFEVLRRLRAFSTTPVIALSASISNGGDAIELGANEFHTKPFKMRELLGRIKTYLD